MNAYVNALAFLLATLFYYVNLKPTIALAEYLNPETYKTYMSNTYTYLAVYVLLVVFSQFLINSSIISTNCGGSMTENMGAAGMLTFIPWILIFGVLVLMLTIYPGFKSAFADVVGYYYVASSANKLITELLVNQELEKHTETNDGSISPERKKALESAADAIVKICGNTSILINQIVPSNFAKYWELLTPLMKEQYRNGGEGVEKMKQDLFSLVLSRDNVGEAMWYIYTGLLIVSIVQLKITTRGCSSNPKTMEANYKKFVEAEEKAKEKQANTEQTYTLT